MLKMCQCFETDKLSDLINVICKNKNANLKKLAFLLNFCHTFYLAEVESAAVSLPVGIVIGGS